MKLNITDHIAIAETRRGVLEDMLDTMPTDTIGYWKTVGDRKYQDGLVVGLKIRSSYDGSDKAKKDT